MHDTGIMEWNFSAGRRLEGVEIECAEVDKILAVVVKRSKQTFLKHRQGADKSRFEFLLNYVDIKFIEKLSNRNFKETSEKFQKTLFYTTAIKFPLTKE